MKGQRFYIYIKSRNRYSNRQYNGSGRRDSTKNNIYCFIR